jgi:hypothetical protein
MKKRRIFFTLLAAAGIAVLVFLLWDHSGGSGRSGSGLVQVQKEASRETSFLKIAQSPDQQESPDAVSIEFDHIALPEALNRLVKQTGITVTADLDESHDRTHVTMQAKAPPAEALRMIADECGLELLKTDEGWWLRPEGSAVAVVYQPSLMIMDEGRIDRLLASLRKIVRDDAGSRDSVTINGQGIRVVAPKRNQTFVSQYLNTVFHETVVSRGEEARLTAMPPASK